MSSTYYIYEAITITLLVKIIFSIVGVAWLVGIVIRAMKADDLVK